MRSSINKVNDEDARDTALLGANYAFRPSSTRSPSVSSVASSSAVAAALRAGSRTPEHVEAAAAMSDRRQDTLAAPALPTRPPQSRSPSHAAALVAAARAATPKPHDGTLINSPSTRPKPTSDLTRWQSVATPISSYPKFTYLIPSTNTLVSLFERKSSTSRKEAPEPISIRSTTSIPIQSPKPLRPDGIRSVFQMEVGPPGRLQGSQAVQEERRQEGMGILGAQQASRSGDLQHRPSQVQGRGISTASSVRQISHYDQDDHNDRRQQGGQGYEVGDRTEVHDFADDRGANGPSQGRAIGADAEDVRVKPPRPASRRTPQAVSSTSIETPPRLPARTQTAPIDIQPRSRPISTYSAHESPSGPTQSVSATYRQLYPKKTTPLTKDDELANAIVASSLASSRSTAKRDVPPPPVTRRQSRGHFFHSRTPSPVKQGLLTTLRKQDSSESEDGGSHPFSKHHKKRLIRKHPNKHHEGDRKRWRDAVTEGERKRYEGVWAANKGLYIVPVPSDSDRRVDSDALSDQVCNVVVRDVWSRSRLPDYELEAVWDLVDTEGIGWLSKEEFVVGMWLIDQRLKGRKLPVKVQPTVWTSVRGLQGIKIRNKQ